MTSSRKQNPKHEESVEGLPTFFSKEAFKAIPGMLFGKIFTVFLYIPISILIVRGLGTESFGIYSLSQSIAEYLVVLCGLGLNVAILRFIPELLVKKNIHGLKRLLTRCFLLETAMCVLCTLILYVFSNFLSRIFNFNFYEYSLLIGLVIFSLLGKEFMNNVLTALYRTTSVAVLSTIQGAIFLSSMVLGFLYLDLTVREVFLFQIASLLCFTLFSSLMLYQYFNEISPYPSKLGIGKKRVLKLSLPSMLDMLLSKLSSQYSEIFFLGFFFGPIPVGYYALAFNLSFQLVTLIPQSLYTLLSSAFAETYTKNPKSIPDLMEGLYILLITMCLPIACFGLFFFSPACDIIYGGKMHQAGLIGGPLCVIQFLALFSVPLSFAIIAKEKILSALWLTVFQIAVNLVVDFFLIRSFGLWGAVLSVLVNFFTTLPARIFLARWLVGGIYFPLSFFLRFSPVCLIVAAAIWYLIPIQGIVTLLLAAALYAIALILTIRFLKIIRPRDVQHFKLMGIQKLTNFIDFLFKIKGT